jgi:hypothetical protein
MQRKQRSSALSAPGRVAYALLVTLRLALDLQRLSEVCALSPGHLAHCTEAASVMLDKFWSPPPPPTPAVVVSDGSSAFAHLSWTAPDDQQRASHDNELEAVEYGACAIAFAAVHALHGYVVHRRAYHGSRTDYVIRRRGEHENDFAKLEVSGTARGDEHQTTARLAAKVRQAQESPMAGPAVAVVVAFRDAVIKIQRG